LSSNIEKEVSKIANLNDEIKNAKTMISELEIKNQYLEVF